MLKHKLLIVVSTLAAAVFCTVALAQQPAAGQAKGKGGGGAKAAKQTRPPVFFRESWKETPGGEHPADQASIANGNLELKLYSPSGEIQVTGTDKDENNPVHLWTGECESACGAAFRNKEAFADLSGLARIRWTHKMSGFHQIRPMVKLSDGTYLIGDRAEGTTTDWLTTEFLFADVHWVKLDPKRMVTTGGWVPSPDLSKVDEIGFADLMPGSGHGQGGWSDVGAVEVYAKSVKRE